MSTDTIDLGDWTATPTEASPEVVAIGDSSPLLEDISSVITAVSTTPLGESEVYTIESTIDLASPSEKIMMSQFGQTDMLIDPNEFVSPYNTYKINPKQTQIYGYVNLKSSDLDSVIETIDAHEFEGAVRNTIVSKLYETALAGDDAAVITDALEAVDLEIGEAEESLSATTDLLITFNKAMSAFGPPPGQQSTQSTNSDNSSNSGAASAGSMSDSDDINQFKAFQVYKEEMNNGAIQNANPGGTSLPLALSYFTNLPESFFLPGSDPAWSNTRNILQALLESEKCMTTGVSTAFLHKFSEFNSPAIKEELFDIDGRYSVQSRQHFDDIMTLSDMGNWADLQKVQPVVNDEGQVQGSESRLYDQVKQVKSRVSSLSPLGQVFYFLNIIDTELRLSVGINLVDENYNNLIIPVTYRTDSSDPLRGGHRYLKSLLGTISLTTNTNSFELINDLKEAPEGSFANLALSKLNGAAFTSNTTDNASLFLTALDTNKDAFGPDKVSHTPEEFFRSLTKGKDHDFNAFNTLLNRTCSRADSIGSVLNLATNLHSDDNTLKIFDFLWKMVAKNTYEANAARWRRSQTEVEAQDTGGPAEAEDYRIMTEQALLQIYATTDDITFKRYMLDCLVARVQQRVRGGSSPTGKGGIPSIDKWPRFSNNNIVNQDEEYFGPQYNDNMKKYFAKPTGTGAAGGAGSASGVAATRIIKDTLEKDIVAGQVGHQYSDWITGVITWEDIIGTLRPPFHAGGSTKKSGGKEGLVIARSPFHAVFWIIEMMISEYDFTGTHAVGPGAGDPGHPIGVTRFSEMDASTLVAFAVEAVAIMVSNFCPIYFVKDTNATPNIVKFSGGSINPIPTLSRLAQGHTGGLEEKWDLMMPDPRHIISGGGTSSNWQTLKYHAIDKLNEYMDKKNSTLVDLRKPGGFSLLGQLNTTNNVDISKFLNHAYATAFPGWGTLNFSHGVSQPQAVYTTTGADVMSAIKFQVMTRFVPLSLTRAAGSYFKLSKLNSQDALALSEELSSTIDSPIKAFMNSSHGKEFAELLSVEQLDSTHQRLKDIKASSDKSSFKLSRTNSYVRKAQKFLFQLYKASGPDVFNEYRPTGIRNVSFTNGAILFAASPSRMLLGYGPWPSEAFVKVVVKRHDQLRPFLNNSFQDRVLIYPTDTTVTMDGISLAFQPEEETISAPTNFLELVELAHYNKGGELVRGIDLIAASNISSPYLDAVSNVVGVPAADESAQVMRSRLANLMADFLLKRYYEERLMMSFSEEDIQIRPDRQKNFSPKVVGILKILGRIMGIPDVTISNLFPIVDGHVSVPSKNSMAYIKATSYNPEITYTDAGEGVQIWKKPNISEVDVQILTDFFNTKPFMVKKVKDHVFIPSLFDKIYASFCPLDNFEIRLDKIEPNSAEGPNLLVESITKEGNQIPGQVWSAQEIANSYSFNKTGNLYQSKVNIDQFNLSISIDDGDAGEIQSDTSSNTSSASASASAPGGWENQQAGNMVTL